MSPMTCQTFRTMELTGLRAVRWSARHLDLCYACREWLILLQCVDEDRERVAFELGSGD